MRRLMLGILAATTLVAIGAPPAQAFTDCHWIRSMCPPDGQPSDPSTPEPGTIGLLALGAAASIGMLRRKNKKQ